MLYFRSVNVCRSHSYSFHTIVVLIFQPLVIIYRKRRTCFNEAFYCRLHIRISNIRREVIFNISQYITLNSQLICRCLCFFGSIKAAFVFFKFLLGNIIKSFRQTEIVIVNDIPHWGIIIIIFSKTLGFFTES